MHLSLSKPSQFGRLPLLRPLPDLLDGQVVAQLAVVIPLVPVDPVLERLGLAL